MACVGNTAHVGPAVIAERPLEAAVANMRMRRDEAIGSRSNDLPHSSEDPCQTKPCALDLRMAFLEATVRRLVRTLRERRWLHRNREAIAHYNRRVAERGLLADDAGLL